MKKREWVYIMNPAAYGISCDICGGNNITWSEFEHMVWCWTCRLDNRGRGGIFTGPIPINVLGLFGLSLDQIHIKTGKRMKTVDMGDHLEWMMDIY